MKRFRNILAYVPAAAGDDDAGLRLAAALARADGAGLTVTDVATAPRSAIGRALHSTAAPAAERDAVATHLQERVATLADDGVAASALPLAGHGAHELVHAVQRHHFDLVVKTARPDQEDRRMRMGALAIRLFHDCPCPVWLVQPDAKERHHRVAAALDPRGDSDELNRAILSCASDVAVRLDAELHVLHAWIAFGELLLLHRMPEDELASYVQESHADAIALLRGALERLGVQMPDDRLHYIKGSADLAIPACADEVGVDLLVVGIVNRPGLAGLVRGKTPDRMLRRVRCSVLAVKPDTSSDSARTG